jgi:hypothetical protein
LHYIEHLLRRWASLKENEDESFSKCWLVWSRIPLSCIPISNIYILNLGFSFGGEKEMIDGV